MKKSFRSAVFVLAALMSLSAVPFGASAEVPDTSALFADVSVLDGGWDTPGSYTFSKNPEAKAAYNAAVKELSGVKCTPIALLGTQIVAGTNYAVLCRVQEKPAKNSGSRLRTEIKVLYIYQDLSGNSAITGTQTIIGSDGRVGGFEANTGKLGIKKNKDVYESYKAAVDSADTFGVRITPVALLGDQVVAGQNHLILCKLSAKKRGGWALVTVYQDLSGNSEVINTELLQLGDYDE